LFSTTSKNEKEVEYGFVKISKTALRPVCWVSHRLFGKSYSQEVRTAQFGGRGDKSQIVENNGGKARFKNHFIGPENLELAYIH
jgi:hypothetical protein